MIQCQSQKKRNINIFFYFFENKWSQGCGKSVMARQRRLSLWSWRCLVKKGVPKRTSARRPSMKTSSRSVSRLDGRLGTTQSRLDVDGSLHHHWGRCSRTLASWDRQESWPSRRLYTLLRKAPAGCGLGGTPVAGSRPLMGSVWPTLSPTTLSLSWV